MASGSARPLTLSDSQQRAQAVSQVQYDLYLDLTNPRDFEGCVTVTFQYSGENEVWLDADGEVHAALEITQGNSGWRELGGRMYPPEVVQGLNAWTFHYRAKYRRNGTGLHRFVDPSDECTYIYSYLCPIFARCVFPCFDQPDLKAILRLRTAAVSETLEEGSKEVLFAETPKLSTYVLAITAGDFEESRDPLFHVPLTLAYRRSLAPFVPVEDFLDVTRRGLDYYERLFNTPMPFPQYTQVLVPEMYMGAMENAACVIINDNNLWKEQPTRSDKIYVYNTVLHELSHMWFGNLVTFSWWDDIWLNESFATYVSYLAQNEAVGEDVWPTFFFYCARGFAIDITPSTHPVRIPILDTDAAQSSFDSITYSKGAALIRALVTEIGRDQFFQGIAEYFRKYAWSNVTMRELVNILQTHATTDLAQWCEDWISTAGVNQVTPLPGKGIRIKQICFPKNSTKLRTHALTVRKYYDKNLQFYDEKKVRVTADDMVDIPDSNPAKFQFLNLDFGCYVMVAYTRDQIELLQNLQANPLVDTSQRVVLWTSFWYMVQTTALPAPQYLDLVQHWLPSESSEDVADYVLGTATICIFSYIPSSSVENYADNLFKTVKDMFLLGNQDLKPIYRKRLPSFVFSLTAVSFVFEAFDWFGFSRTNRWRLLMVKSAYLGIEEVRQMLEQELRLDGDSDMVRRFRCYCEASAYDNKEATWEQISKHSDDYSLPEYTLLLEGFNRRSQGDLLQPFRPSIFALLRKLIDSDDREVTETFLEEMQPEYEDPRLTIASLKEIQTEKGWAKQMIEKSIDKLKVKEECQDTANIYLAGKKSL